jgi:hypothetical protein
VRGKDPIGMGSPTRLRSVFNTEPGASRAARLPRNMRRHQEPAPLTLEARANGRQELRPPAETAAKPAKKKRDQE